MSQSQQVGTRQRRAALRVIRRVVTILVAAGAAAWVAAVFAAHQAVPFLMLGGAGAVLLATTLGLTAIAMSRAIDQIGINPERGPPKLMPELKMAAAPARRRRRLRFAVLGPIVLLAVLAVLGGRWYFYVTNTDSPFDEVGIDLNIRAPAILRAWGCARLKATFEHRTMPPYGCARADRSWL